MGLFDNIVKNKLRKRKDNEIEKAENLMKEGRYYEARNILYDIFDKFPDDDAEYREEYIDELIDRCGRSMKEQEAKSAEEMDKFLTDTYIETIETRLCAGDWRTAIETLDSIEVECSGSYRSEELEALCIKAQEMCFDSDEVNSWEDAVYSQMYIRKKNEYIDYARKMVRKGDFSAARNTLLLLDKNYKSALEDDIVKALWDVVFKNEKAETAPKDEFYVVPRTDTQTQEKAENFESEVPQREDTLQDLQKQEAMERLNTLAKDGKIDGKIYLKFSRNILCGSFTDADGRGYIKELDENDDLYLLAKSFEEEIGCMVYHAVDAGRTVYLLNVNKNPDRWEEERPGCDMIDAQVFSLDEDFNFLDSVRIFNNNGALGVDYSLDGDEYCEYSEDEKEEAEETEYIRNVTEEQQQAEATARIRELAEKLGFSQKAVEWWEKKGKLVTSDMEKGFVSSVCTVRDIKERIKVFEEKKHAKVYHIIQNEEGAYLLYVGGDKDLWPDEKLTLNDISVFSDVTTAGGYNIEAYFMDNYTEVYNAFAEVELFCKDGALSLKLIEKEKDTDMISGVYSNTELDKEIRKRLRDLSDRLGLDEMAYTNWCDGRICCSRKESDGSVTVFPVEEDSEYAHITEQMEKAVNCMVYHIVDMGENLYLLNIHFDSGLKYGRLWQDSDTISMLCCSRDNPDDALYGDMDVKVTDGALVIIEDEYEYTDDEQTAETDNTEEAKVTAEESAEDTACETEPEEASAVIDEYDEKIESEKTLLAERLTKIAQASTLIAQKKYDEAKEILDYVKENYKLGRSKESFDYAYSLCNTGITGELVKDDAEKTVTEIDGKDAVQWYNKGCAFHNDKKYTPALQCFENAAKLGIAEAMNNVAAMYSMGLGTQADINKSFYWREKAALAGHHVAMFTLSGMYYNGEGVEKDNDKSFYWRQKAAESGDPVHCFGLAHAYDNGIGTEKDAEKAFYWIEKAAQGGLDNAIRHAASRYDSGYGTAKDKAKALYWYEKSAEMGDADAMLTCYRRYIDAIGTEKNEDKASYWLQKACEAGNPQAWYEYGVMLIDFGRDEQDVQNGYALLADAGEKGCTDAMMRLAYNYMGDEASKIDKNEEKAFYWFEKAANAGVDDGIESTYLCYFYGRGTQPNHEKAMEWVHIAVKKQLWDVPAHLANELLQVAKRTNNEKLYESALSWCELAALGGHKGAKDALSSLYIHCIQCEISKESADLAKIVKYADEFINTEAYENCNADQKIVFLFDIAQTIIKDPTKTNNYVEQLINYLEMAADLGSNLAMSLLSDVYCEETFDCKDKEKSFYWCKKAVDNGCDDAVIELAEMYYVGFGCEQDAEKAVELFSRCADAGNIEAKQYLMHYYSGGRNNGKVLDLKKVYELSLELAEHEDAKAMSNLGLMHLDGILCDKDYDKAFEYLQRAVDKDFIPAYHILGIMYENGYGRDPDLGKALEMYKKAADGGWEKAKEKVAELTHLN